MAELTDIRETVREKYAAAAKGAGSAAAPWCSGPGGVTCTPADDAGRFGGALYDEDARRDLPRAALDASLGCGVPTAVADLHDGETVLDLGSGAGADVLISARTVGPAGKVIGVDMTDEMLELARRGAADAGARTSSS